MPSQPLRTVNTAVVISGIPFPVLQWKATLANQGSMGTASAEGALSDLVDSGLDIIAASQGIKGAEFDIYAGYDDSIDLIFSGLVDVCEIDWDANSFEIQARDFSSLLNDGKQTVAGLKYRNQTVAQIVQQIADQFDLEADITDLGVKAGPEMNGETFFNPQPQTYWSLLQSLAETCGYECYVTPEQRLYFGPEKDQGKITVNYGAAPGSGVENPGWGLRITYNPRNNSNIIVKALSVNPQTTKPVVASAKAPQVKVGKGRKTKTSLVVASQKIRTKSGKARVSNAARSVYYIRLPGMTPEQAQARCKAMADELARHQIICSLSIEGLTKIKLHSTVTLKEGTIDLYGFAGVDLNVAEVTHSFSMEQGFVTSIRAIAQVENV